jgi:hypothetical protein
MKKLIILTWTLFFFLTQQNLFGQPQNVTVSCGKQIKQEFGTAEKEKHEIKITLNAGDKLNFKIIPTGDYLNVRAEIKDPANGQIYPADPNRYIEPMFTNHLRSLEISTGVLSASGTYTIIVYNNYKSYKHDSRAGEYTFITTCYKKDGTIIQN